MEGREDNGRFKKGNLFALGHGMGRPPIYDDPMVMFEKIAEYLEWEDKQKGKPGKGLYTLEGAALYLGFSSVQSMYDYEKRSSDFSYVINKYRLFLTDWNVKKLYWGGTTYGATFWLKNKSDYKDEVIQHQNQTITHVQPQVLNTNVPLSGNENEVKI